MIGRFGMGGTAASRRSLWLAVSIALGGLAIVCGVALFQTAAIGGNTPLSSDVHAVDGGVTSAAVAAWTETPTFPVVVRPGQRYLEDAAGTPFLIHGDAAWSLIARLAREDVDRYLDDRRARGFNTIAVSLIEAGLASNARDNAYDHPPFLVPGDYSTPNEKYFAHADWVLRRAAEKGFLVLLAPTYMATSQRAGPESWYHAMVVNGPQRLRQYGKYLGRRYRDFKNILWLQSGDDNPPRKDLVRVIAEEIRGFDARAPNTAHCAPETTALDYWQGEPWLQVNTLCNTSEAIYGVALEQYLRPDGMPFFLIESAYENQEIFEATERHIRAQAYHAVLSGAAGQVFGNNPIWHFDGRERSVAWTLRNVGRAAIRESGTTGRIIDGRQPGLVQIIYNLVFPGTWQEALGSPGAQSMTQLRSLLTTVPWWLLEPDVDNTLLTDGLRSGFERAVAAHTTDGSFAILYLPNSREITVDLGQLVGPKIAAHWYDPADGQFSAVRGAPFPAAGSRQFMPAPVDNRSGFDDWVLVLKSIS